MEWWCLQLGIHGRRSLIFTTLTFKKVIFKTFQSCLSFNGLCILPILDSNSLPYIYNLRFIIMLTLRYIIMVLSTFIYYIILKTIIISY